MECTTAGILILGRSHGEGRTMTAWHLKAVSKCVPPSCVPRQSPNSHSAKSRITSPGVCEEPASGELIMTNTLPPTAPFVGIDVAKDSWPFMSAPPACPSSKPTTNPASKPSSHACLPWPPP